MKLLSLDGRILMALSRAVEKIENMRRINYMLDTRMAVWADSNGFTEFLRTVGGNDVAKVDRKIIERNWQELKEQGRG